MSLQSSSSGSSPSESSSSESSSASGFAFNGSVYPTYQEMVAAKRERNRKVLAKSVDELSSVFGRDKGSEKSDDAGARKPIGNKRKRREGSDRSVGGPPRSLRRNPTRTTRSTAARSATSSISSQSHASSSCLRRGERNASRSRIPIPDIPAGRTELRESCPQIGPGWTMRVRARKKSTSAKPGPTVDRVFISPAGRILQNLKDVDNFLEGGESVVSGNDTDANNSVSFGDASVFSTYRSSPETRAPHRNPTRGTASETTSDALREALKELPTAAGATAPGRSSWSESIVVKDASAALEGVLLNGGRVRAREAALGDFVRSPDGGRSVGVAKGESVHLGDWGLYRPVAVPGGRRPGGGGGRDDGGGIGDDSGPGGSVDDDDLAIPDEFLAPDGRESEPETAPDRGRRQHRHSKIRRGALPPNNPVEYNNVVRERHAYYASEGPDRRWDEEFGDGVDPTAFAEERRGGRAAAAADGDGRGGPERRENDGESDAESFGTETYASSVLQRCWDRAVHAASSTVTVCPTAGHREGPKAPLDASIKGEDGGVAVRNRMHADSILHHKAMNIVDSILDVILANGNGHKLGQTYGARLEKKRGDWRHVLDSLQTAARQTKNAVDQKGTAACGPVIQVNEKRCPMPLNYISLKALSMRLIERYSSASQTMPP